MKISIGLTGASCSIYGISLAKTLGQLGHDVVVLFTKNGLDVASYELKIPLKNKSKNEILDTLFEHQSNIMVEENDNIFASCASGTNAMDAMVVLPCSMGTLGAIANGLSNNLMQRTADVMLKERKPLILCTREAPYSLIHLNNMTQCTLAGAVILPCSPGFYHHPQEISDLINFMVGKVLDALKIEHQVSPKWRGENWKLP